MAHFWIHPAAYSANVFVKYVGISLGGSNNKKGAVINPAVQKSDKHRSGKEATA